MPQKHPLIDAESDNDSAELDTLMDPFTLISEIEMKVEMKRLNRSAMAIRW